MKTTKKYLMDCHLAGRKYHDADEVWEDLKVGTLLRLERDEENRYDANAVAVMYDKGEESYCLGYVPRGANEYVASLLEMGWTEVFECRISRVNPEAHPDGQVWLTVKIRRNEKKRK